ncbi:MAG: VWA domain-containing protein [Cellulosilyticum sp.]|nr:VWA domain-containing protein [Cellulosilyticum sp.]
MGTRRLSGLAILFSLIGAGMAYLLGEFILVKGEALPEYLQMGLYFGIGAMMITIMVIASQKVSPQLIGYRWKEMYFKTSLKLFVPTTLIMVGILGGVFQLIYGLEINEPKTIQDIVIAMDRSGSMDTTDPQGERYEAINSFIDHLEGKKRVAMLTFNEHTSLALDFESVSTKAEKEAFKTKLANLNLKNDGQTGIQNVMQEAYKMIKADGKGASVILVSDGAPTDNSAHNIPSLVQDFVAQKIPVYTIGMMYEDPTAESYLQEIANLTGGTYFSTSDTTMLKEVFGMIEYIEEKGTIITPRTGAYAESSLHKVLRVIFLIGMSIAMAVALGIMFDNKYLVKGMVVGALVGGFIGSLLTEYLFLSGYAPVIVRLIYWFFVGVSMMSFTWCVAFKDSYHGTRSA